MTTFFFKAYDTIGHKTAGTIEASNPRDADQELRQQGLKPYFIHDFLKVKHALHKKKRRQKMIFGAGAFSVAAAFFLSGFLVQHAGRERELTVEDYKNIGAVTESNEQIVSRTEEGRAFASEVFQLWESFYPGTVTRVEVTGMMMTLHVTANVRRIPERELEMVLTNLVKALHRRMGAATCNVLMIEGEIPFAKIGYDSMTNALSLKTYR